MVECLASLDAEGGTWSCLYLNGLLTHTGGFTLSEVQMGVGKKILGGRNGRRRERENCGWDVKYVLKF